MSSAPGDGLLGLGELLASMEPVRDPAEHVFLTCAHGTDVSSLEPFGVMTEAEGTTVILRADRLADALSLGCSPVRPPRMTLITLQVHSSLLAVGLTAAVASALADAGISCNVVAGYYHDHLFVPVDDAARALELLHALSG